MSAIPKRAERPDGARVGHPQGSASEAAVAQGECREIAKTLRADGFAALTVAAGAARRLQPCPSVGADDAGFLSGFLGRFDGEAAQHAMASSAPFWWEGARPPAAAASLRRLSWAVRGGFDDLSAPGIGFPCATERGACGAMLFWGENVALEAPALFAVHARLFRVFEVLSALRPRGTGALPAISKREIECLRLTAKGLTSEEIAEALALSVHTANQHLAAAATKLDAVNRVQAVAKALRLGLID